MDSPLTKRHHSMPIHQTLPTAYGPPLQMAYPTYSQPHYLGHMRPQLETVPGVAYPSGGYPATRFAYPSGQWGLSHPSPYGSMPLASVQPIRIQPIPYQPGQQHTPQIPPSPLPLSARGPPPKPRQSGWAVWVGNLPQDTTVIHMRDHFSTEARYDIESVFLIKKTNCAFVNYCTEPACLQAIRRHNGNLFRGHRLVCRMRRASSSDERSVASPSPPGSDVPSLSDSLSSVTDTPSSPDDGTPLIVRGDDFTNRETHAHSNQDSSSKRTDEAVLAGLASLSITPKVKARMFILKSLTLQDLLVSTRDGTWVTQPHNEERLNEAFHGAEDVYLVFSANKSGQYFGYARMESPIPQGSGPPSKPLVQQSARDSQGHEQSQRKIPTSATAIAPQGYIIDDSARGTIFWEAEREDVLTGAETASSGGVAEGKPFAIQWLSTNQVPFHATRGLRNPLNSNREVKIARDGTELGTLVGARLLQLFHRGETPITPT